MKTQEEEMISFMDELLEGVNLRLGSNQYPLVLFFVKDNETIMYQDTEKGYLWVNYNKIWFQISVKFKLDYDDTQELIRRYMVLRYNLRRVRPRYKSISSPYTTHLDSI